MSNTIWGNTVGTTMNPQKVVEKSGIDYVKKVTDISPITRRVYGVDSGSTDTVMYYVENGFSTNTIPIRNEFGTFGVGRPFEDEHPTPKWYVDDLIKYKTIADVTLDDTNSGTNVVMAEMDLETFLLCNEFVIYVEVPITEAVSSATVSGYITNINQNAYAQCVLYNFGNISTTASGVYRAFSQIIKNKNGMLLGFSGAPSSHTGANSTNTGVRSHMEAPVRYSSYYTEYPPYLKISISSTTFPTGTRIIMEGR